MNDTLTYIEAYFQDQLSGKEKLEFEQRCQADDSFAGEVAFYIAARQSIKDELLRQKKAEWQAATVRTLPVSNAPRIILRQPWLRYAAAACVVIVVSLFFLLRPANTRTLANEYIDEYYQQLKSLKMGAADSIELGKIAYKNKEYDRAVTLFETVAKSHTDNAEAKEYAGLVYLEKENYDKAIRFFESLANMKGLYNNSGLFLTATAMILRNKNEDMQKAKLLLEQVVKENLEGSDEAKKLLKKF